MSSALVIIVAVTLFALYLGVRARHGHDMSLEQWTVGGRSFGTAFVFLLMAGEIYTTFTFLGGSGFAYGKGAPVYYILAYATLAYVLSYWLLPPIWRFAKTHRLVSQPHFFARKYDSHALGVLVAVVDVAALIPYLVLQLKGLGIIVATASYGVISSSAAIWIGAAVVTIYVIASGVRGSAWNSVMKDLLILAVVLFLGIYLPIHHYGGIGEMFHAIDAARPGFLTFPDKGSSVTWFQSTVLLTALGFFMWPHTFGSVFTAKNEQIFRRNAMVLPIYQLILLRWLRGDAEGARAQRRRHRPVAVPAVDPELRPMVRWRGRRGRRADRTGAGLDDSHHRVDAACERHLPRRARTAGNGCRRRETGARDGAGGGAGRGAVYAAWRRDDRRVAADGVQLRHAAVPGAGMQPRAA
jgi:hypothetical protein